MHARHRNGPGNGYWSNAMGMRGQAATSRMSPEGSMIDHRMYSSEHRNNNRGSFGRGSHSRQFQPPLPPSHGIDIFMEAGRLAAEYLVAKGVLPPNALSGTLKNGSLKNQMGRLHVFRPHEADVQIPMDGRSPDNTHLGNAALERGSMRRRNFVDDNSMDGSRNTMRWRRRMGSFKNQGPEVNTDSRKSGAWADRSRDIPSIGAESDASSGQPADQPVNVEGHGGMQTLSLGEVVQEGAVGANLLSGFEDHHSVEDAGAKASSSSTEKLLSADAKVEATKESDDANKSDEGADVVNEERIVNDLEILQNENEITDSARGDTLASKDNVDLRKHFKFPRIPTKARSSLKVKSSKGGQEPMNEDDKITGRELSVGSQVHVVDVPDESSTGNVSSYEIHELKSLDSDVRKAPGVDKEQPIAYMTRSRQSRSTYFQEQSVFKGQKELDEGLSVVGYSTSMCMNKGLKRPIDDDANGKEDFKKLRDCSSIDIEANGCLPLSSSMENQPTSQEPRISQSTQSALSPDQKSFNVSPFPFPKSQDESCEFTGFKTCDLNLSGTCDTSENDNVERVLIFPSVIETGKEAAPVDFGLSMSNSSNVANKNARLGVNNNNIEVIDLEIDSGQEDNIFSHPEKRSDSVFTDLDGFPNNLRNANEIPDVQDGYGLMFSDLLGNHSPHNSSVPTGLDSLHSEMGLPNGEVLGLPNGEGILGDDDSIYMSLGEIPISFLSTWEQPTQDYGKPF